MLFRSPEKYVQLRITQSWVNVTQKGDYHHLHWHKNSLISGCLYVDSDGPGHEITFHRLDPSLIAIHASDFNVFNSQTCSYESKIGRLVLFPSSLSHSVPLSKNEHRRVSLAFNTFPVGILGEKDSSTELVLSQ